MIDQKTTEAILYLSRLTATEEEKAKLTGQVGAILDYFEVLKKYPTNPTQVDAAQAVGPEALRADEVQPSLETKAVKSFAVGFLDQYFSVPKILGDGEST